MGIEALVLSGKVVILLFIHLLVDDILFGDTKRTACALLVNLRCPPRRLYPGLETAVTPSRCSDVRTATTSASM